MIAETTIDQARLDLQAGQLPPDVKDAAKTALDTLADCVISMRAFCEGECFTCTIGRNKLSAL
jgi:hypothetical protein